jgi:hypothetical protein
MRMVVGQGRVQWRASVLTVLNPRILVLGLKV